MLTVNDIIDSITRKQCKLDDDELRRLPYKDAFIYGRVSSPRQMRESIESLRGIALLVDIAKGDGYNTTLTTAAVSKWITDIQEGRAEPGVWVDGQVTVELRDLGISGLLNDDRRVGFANMQQTIRDDQTGCIYLNEGVSRLSRDEDGITPPVLLKLFREHNCRIRTRRRVLNPCIQRDRDILEEEFRDARKERRTMDTRLCQGRRDKADEGKFVGEPVPPGFTVQIIETKPSGRRVYGKYQPYPPHAEIDVKVLREYVKYGGSKTKTYRALDGPAYPLFPPEMEYMERLTALRRATRTEQGYLISPAMIRLLALNLKLIGVWTWGDAKPITGNHDAIVPEDLFLAAYDLAKRSGKPRGRGIKHEPLEWDGLLFCCNHDLPLSISGHSAKMAYRCQSGYVQRREPSCFDIAAHYLDKPLTTTVLRQLDFTPFAEEVLMQFEADIAYQNLEEEQKKKEIVALERKLENLRPYLGCGNKEREEFYWEQCEKALRRLDELKSRPVSVEKMHRANYQLVKDFLTGLPGKWNMYSRTMRNRLLKLFIERVDIHHEGQVIEATIHWKTGQVQVVEICRARAKRNSVSLWTVQEKGLLKMLWPSASQETIKAALPERSWKSIAHQAYNLGLRRSPELSNHTPRRRWEAGEEHEVKKNYEAGSPIADVAASFSRSQTAVLQRAWEKSWRRPNTDRRETLTESQSIKQNPKVANGISSGSFFGGQVTIVFEN
ncbi:hypothetical protein ACFLTV_01950 [Chloroflexota bacterium]